MEEKNEKNLLTKLYYNISKGGSLESVENLFLAAKKKHPKITRR